MTDQELIEELTKRIAARPSLVPAVLEAVKQGMAAWEASVQKRLDSAADWAISSALGMPKNRSAWRVKLHGSMARMVAVGWNLVTRKPSSIQEIELVKFVNEADTIDDTAEEHYRTLNARQMIPLYDE